MWRCRWDVCLPEFGRDNRWMAQQDGFMHSSHSPALARYSPFPGFTTFIPVATFACGEFICINTTYSLFPYRFRLSSILRRLGVMCVAFVCRMGCLANMYYSARGRCAAKFLITIHKQISRYDMQKICHFKRCNSFCFTSRGNLRRITQIVL